MFVCHFLLTQQVLPAAGCCQQWGLLPTAGEWPRHSSAATPSSFPFLQHLPIGSAPKARFDPCTFFSSAVASHVLSCSPSSSQQQKGLVSPPHSWRLPTAGSGFLSNLSPAELGLLALSAVGQMKRWLLANFSDKHHLAPAAPLGWNWVQLSYQLIQMIPLFFKVSKKKKC